MIDIGNPGVLDCREITRDEMLEILRVTTTKSLDAAIAARKIPAPADRLGPGGSARWFVGQLRAWNGAIAAMAIKRDNEARRSAF